MPVIVRDALKQADFAAALPEPPQLFLPNRVVRREVDMGLSGWCRVSAITVRVDLIDAPWFSINGRTRFEQRKASFRLIDITRSQSLSAIS